MGNNETTSKSSNQEQPSFPKSIVCIYAHRDESFYRELQIHLSVWQNKDYIQWLELSPGADISQTLLAFIQKADLVLLLLSSNFFANTVCKEAMERALAEQARRDVPVVSVLAKACNWQESDCGTLKVLPENELPIAEWGYEERAYEQIRLGLADFLGIAAPAGSRPGQSKLFSVPALPKDIIPRSNIFDDLKCKILEQRSGQVTAITTALHGAGGFGKTTLALALCYDPEIQAAFPDGILWLQLKEEPLQEVVMLNHWLSVLEGKPVQTGTPDEAWSRWQTSLRQRTCLLVIDDIWQASELNRLLEGGPQCVRLVTTRNDLLLPRYAERVWVDAMEPQEARAVLCQNLPEEINQVVYQFRMDALAIRLGCWPLLLNLANGMLVNRVRKYRQSLIEAFTEVEQAYKTRGVVAFRLDSASERYRTVEACMAVSIQHLEEFVPSHYHATERYQELAVFPDDTDIPIATLQVFWKGSAGLEFWETNDLCTRLFELSLLQTCDLEKGIIRLHDVLRNYLEQRTWTHLPVLHARLLNAYWQLRGLQRWSNLPLEDSYLWLHLVRHLCKAGHREALHATLTDLMYLTFKALYVSVPALEADLLLASTMSPEEPDGAAPSFFPSLHQTIVQISHLLRQVQTPAEMGGLLLSHLNWEPSFAEQRLPLAQELPRPFLAAWHPLPGKPSPALLRTLHGHAGGLRGCAVSPDGSIIISASNDRTLKVWDAATGAERFTLTGHTHDVRGCVVSSDGSIIVSASDDKTLKIWDTATGAERFTLTGHTEQVSSCAVSPDGRFIVSASNDRTLKVWDAATGAEYLTLTGHTSIVSDCAVSPDGCWIVSASGDRTLKVWDRTTGAERLTLHGHTSGVNSCAVSPDGHWIVSASNDQTLKIWDAATGEERFTLTGHNNSVRSCAVSPDGRWIVSASNDRTLRVWNAVTGRRRFILTGHTHYVRDCAVSPDGRFIISASNDKTLKVWDVATGRKPLTFTGHTHYVNDCAVSPDGKWIVSASNDKTLKVWDVATGAVCLTFKAHSHEIRGCAVSPDGRWIVSTSSGKTLKVLNATTGEKRLIIKAYASGRFVGGNSCAVSSDGHWIVSASGDKTLKVWDAATGREQFTLSGHTHYVNDCAVSPDGHWIVSASGDKTLKIWDTATGREQFTLSGHTDRVSSCAVSPDGRWIVSASGDKTLKIWDAATGAERLTLTGHIGGINGCAISPDGRWIVSASADRTLKIWNCQTGHCLVTFPVDGSLAKCAFHPNGELLVACGAQGVYFLRLSL